MTKQQLIEKEAEEIYTDFIILPGRIAPDVFHIVKMKLVEFYKLRVEMAEEQSISLINHLQSLPKEKSEKMQSEISTIYILLESIINEIKDAYFDLDRIKL